MPSTFYFNILKSVLLLAEVKKIKWKKITLEVVSYAFQICLSIYIYIYMHIKLQNY